MRLASLFFLLAALFYGPLAQGSTTEPLWYGLDALLLLGGVIHFLGRWMDGERPRVPRVPVVCLTVLLILGVLVTANPRFVYDPVTKSLDDCPSHLNWLPGTLDQTTSTIALVHLGALAVAFLALVDLCRERAIRWLMLQGIASCGFLITLIGLVYKASQNDLFPFSSVKESKFFATYFYHGNAAAYLNLCWPAAMALMIRGLGGSQPRSQALWVNAFVFTFAAVFVNVSKFGHIVGIPALIFALVLFRRGLPVAEARLNPLVSATVATVLSGVVGLLILPSIASSFERWEVLIRNGGAGRLITYEAVLVMISKEPWFGVGPGSFYLGFPFFTGYLGDTMAGVYIHAHQDYLQTVAEWGLVGTIPWAVLLVGGYLKGWREHAGSHLEISTVAAMVAIGVVAVHSLIDFPLQIGSLRYYACVYFALLWRNRSPGRPTGVSGFTQPRFAPVGIGARARGRL